MFGFAVQRDLETAQSKLSVRCKLSDHAPPVLMFGSPCTDHRDPLPPSVGEDRSDPPVIASADAITLILWKVLGSTCPEGVDIQHQDSTIAPSLGIAHDLHDSWIILLVVRRAWVHHDPDY